MKLTSSYFPNRLNPMPFCFSLIILATMGSGLASVSFAQEQPQPDAKLYRLDPPPPPKTGFRADFLSEIAYFEDRYTKLAEAIPAEKYSWRPADGTRTIGEVFAHVAVMNALSRRRLEEPLRPGVTYGISNEDVEKNTMSLANDKEKLVQQLRMSFTSLRQEVLLLSDSDAETSKKLFGKEATVQGAFFLLTQNLGEHLGQLIAYSRINGIAPPWSQEAGHNH